MLRMRISEPNKIFKCRRSRNNKWSYRNNFKLKLCNSEQLIKSRSTCNSQFNHFNDTMKGSIHQITLKTKSMKEKLESLLKKQGWEFSKKSKTSVRTRRYTKSSSNSQIREQQHYLNMNNSPQCLMKELSKRKSTVSLPISPQRTYSVFITGFIRMQRIR